MASLPSELSGSTRSLLAVLRYFRRYRFPVSQSEVWYWQPYTSFPKSAFSFWPHQASGWLYLEGFRSDVAIRRCRHRHSRLKFKLARQVVALLKTIPSVAAIYLTGSLAMANCEADDDIDLMIVCYPHTLWLTRLLVIAILSLTFGRRPSGLPEHRSVRVKNRICDNLYLDTDHLAIDRLPVGQNARTASARLFLSHEILQARCLFDRNGVHPRFIHRNSWVKTYLPVAYAESVKKTGSLPPGLSPPRALLFLDCLLRPINRCLFRIQYLHMRSRLTSEKVGSGYAFFHPRRTGQPG